MLSGRAPIFFAYFFLVVACAIALPRGAPIWLSMFAIAGAAEYWLAKQPPGVRLGLLSPLLWTAAFAAVAAASALWAPSPTEALRTSSIFVVAVLAVLGCGIGIFTTDRRLIETRCGLTTGLCVGLAFIVIETVTDLYLTRMVMTVFPGLQTRYLGKHIDVVDGVVTYLTDSFMNRPTLAATMLMVPGLAVAQAMRSKRMFQLILVVAATYAVCVLLFSRHQSSQLALICWPSHCRPGLAICKAGAAVGHGRMVRSRVAFAFLGCRNRRRKAPRNELAHCGRGAPEDLV